MRLRTILIPFATAALVAASPARAEFFPAETIDTGSAIRSVGDVDLARDGTGAVAYLKDDGGVPHVFVSRMVGGTFVAPERVDPASAAPASSPSVAVSDGGRIVVAFVSGGQLGVAVRPAGAPAFGPVQVLADGASAPSVDMSLNGVGYLSFTAPGASAADVRVARLDRKATTFVLLPTPLDIDPARDAGVGAGRSITAVSAEGNAVVTWVEAGHGYLRRVFDDHLSTAPQELGLPVVAGRGADPASVAEPRITIEDDSSFAWMTFRQALDDGRVHTVARRLVGSLLDPPVQVDGTGFGGDQTASAAIGMNGRGEGLAVTGTAARNVNVALLHDDVFFPPVTVSGANAIDPRPLGDVADNLDGYATWMQGVSPLSAAVFAVRYELALEKRTVPGPGPVAQLSNPDFGPVDPNGGFDFAVDRVGDAVAVFVQGAGDGRRLVFGGYDRTPGILSTSTTSRFRNQTRPRLAWSTSFDLWGPITYTAEIDGVVVGQANNVPRLPLTNELGEGVHTWRVTATDRRGQSYVSKPGELRVDVGAPKLSFRVDGVRTVGRSQLVRATASDPRAGAVAGSGVRRVIIDFGDGARSTSRKARHTYRKGGRYTIRVSARDKADNVTVVRRTITVKKKSKSKKKKT